MMKAILILSIIATATSVAIKPIKIGTIGKKTFYELNNVKVTWPEAERNCEEAGLQFGQLENFNEFNFVYENRRQNHYWIGATQKGISFKTGDIDTTKSFQFVKGSPVTEINFNQNSETFLCLWTGGHHTTVDKCLHAKYLTLCESTA